MPDLTPEEFDERMKRHDLYHDMERRIYRDRMAMVDDSGDINSKENRRLVENWGNYAYLSSCSYPKLKQEKGKMKEKYLYLKDRTKKVRVIICLLERSEPTKGFLDTGFSINSLFYGIAIRSDDDLCDLDMGKKLAKRRAEREIRGRKRCFVSQQKAIRNLWSLCWEDFQKLMYFTGGMVCDFAKGDQWNDEIQTIKGFMKGMYRHVASKS